MELGTRRAANDAKEKDEATHEAGKKALEGLEMEINGLVIMIFKSWDD